MASVAVQPRRKDIKCVVGACSHPGTEVYRNIIRMNEVLYSNAPEEERKAITESIVQALLDDERRFLKELSAGKWYIIDRSKAYSETQQLLHENHIKVNGLSTRDSPHPTLLAIAEETVPTNPNENVSPESNDYNEAVSKPSDQDEIGMKDADGQMSISLGDLCCSESVTQILQNALSTETVYDFSDGVDRFTLIVNHNDATAVPCNHHNHHCIMLNNLSQDCAITTDDGYCNITDKAERAFDSPQVTSKPKLINSPSPPHDVTPSTKGNSKPSAENDPTNHGFINRDWPSELVLPLTADDLRTRRENVTGDGSTFVNCGQTIVSILTHGEESLLTFPLDTDKECHEPKYKAVISDKSDEVDTVPVRLLTRTSGKIRLLTTSTQSTDSFKANLNNVEENEYDPEKHNYNCIIVHVPCDGSGIGNVSNLTMQCSSCKLSECQQPQQHPPLLPPPEQQESGTVDYREQFKKSKRDRTNSGGTLCLVAKKLPSSVCHTGMEGLKRECPCADVLLSSVRNMFKYSYSSRTSTLSSSSSWFRFPQTMILVATKVTKCNLLKTANMEEIATVPNQK